MSEKKALVVDDSRAMRSILRQALEHNGFAVQEAADGSQALTALDSGSAPDVVFVDLHMPNMGGMEFVEAVRSDHRHDETQIIIASGDCDQQQIENALAAGADEYLMKPFDDDAVAEKLELLGMQA